MYPETMSIILMSGMLHKIEFREQYARVRARAWKKKTMSMIC